MLKKENWKMKKIFMPYIHNTNLMNYVNILSHDFHKTAKLYKKTRTKKNEPFTLEEEVHIVNVINKSDLIGLAKYDIKEQQWKKILKYRERNGNFKRFDDLLMSQDNITALIKLCRSILNDGKPNVDDKIDIKIDKKLYTLSNKINPPINKIIKKQIKTITGLQVWNDTISWAAINENNVLIDWNRAKYENQSKISPLPLINQIINIVNYIPEADAYVMEAADPYSSSKSKMAMSKVKTSVQKINLDRHQALSTTITALGIRKNITENIRNPMNTIPIINHVFMLKSRYYADKFHLTIGSEAIAGDSVVEDILKGDQNQKEKYLPNLKDFSIDSSIFNNYSSKITRREHFHSVLLLTLAFADIVRSHDDDYVDDTVPQFEGQLVLEKM